MLAPEVLQRSLTTARVLWAALLASQLVITALSLVMASPGGGAWRSQIVVMTVLGVADAIASFIVPERTAATNARSRSPQMSTGEPLPGGAPGPLTLANPSAATRTALAIGNTALILSMALSEVVTLLGFSMHLVGAPAQVSLPFCLVGIALGGVRFPTVKSLVGAYERAHSITLVPEGTSPRR
jgi:hypothetical protein